MFGPIGNMMGMLPQMMGAAGGGNQGQGMGNPMEMLGNLANTAAEGLGEMGENANQLFQGLAGMAENASDLMGELGGMIPGMGG
jgi:hypothetical protein